ncbi:MAG: hypothetical protein HN348_32675 [Proteobacteria bacterium]|jgi:hypothetical protein|nr:hypothetical protein [Pseudomonadota bacterium]
MYAKSLLFCALLAFSAPALAADAGRSDAEWMDVYRRARTVSYVSGLSPLATAAMDLGIGLALLGDNPKGLDGLLKAIVVGVLVIPVTVFGLGVGPPMLAGSSLRAQKALSAVGHPSGVLWGHAAWAAWGGGLVVGAAATGIFAASDDDMDSLLAVAALSYGGGVLLSYVFGLVQWGQNGKIFRSELGRGASLSSSARRAEPILQLPPVKIGFRF